MYWGANNTSVHVRPITCTAPRSAGDHCTLGSRDLITNSDGVKIPLVASGQWLQGPLVLTARAHTSSLPPYTTVEFEPLYGDKPENLDTLLLGLLSGR